MTIDERLEKLLERHEALTQTVELLANEVRDIAGAAGHLLEIAEIHERRIQRLEGGAD